MTKHQLRTFVEHHLLPQLFFEHRAAVLAKLLSDEGKFAASLYQDSAESNDETSPYTENDFKIVPLDLDGEYRSIIIILPAPEEALECYIIVLCFKTGDEDVQNLRYFTIEKTASSPIIEMMSKELNIEQPAPAMMLCEWTEDHTHRNYGSISPGDKIECRISEILKEKE